MMQDIISQLASYDPEVGSLIQKEFDRQRNNIELIASENIVSEETALAMGTILTNKYAEGTPGKRYYGGCHVVDDIETIAIERAKELFQCEFANVQPHSGAQANMAVTMAICEPGDTIMGMDLNAGGHLTHGAAANFSGRFFNVVPYGVTDDGFIDYDAVEKQAMECKPKMMIAGASAYPRIIDFARFRDIADKVGAVLWVDMAHIAGLVAGGQHPSPIPYAHVTTTTTHKTLRGPRGGLILSSNEVNEQYNFNKAVFPGSQGGPLEHVIASKAIALGEALKPEFKEYQAQIVKNAAALAEALKNVGFKLVSGGTDNHLMLADLTVIPDLTGKDLQNKCDEVHITLNRNAIPNDPRSHFVTSGVRIGTPAITARGFREDEMPAIAECIWDVATDFDGKKDDIIARVAALVEKHPIYE